MRTKTNRFWLMQDAPTVIRKGNTLITVENYVTRKDAIEAARHAKVSWKQGRPFSILYRPDVNK
jgi:hypothetical protein